MSTAAELFAQPGAVLAPHAVVAKVKEAVYQYGHIAYHDERFSELGFENVIVWGTPTDDGYIVLVAGES